MKVFYAAAMTATLMTGGAYAFSRRGAPAGASVLLWSTDLQNIPLTHLNHLNLSPAMASVRRSTAAYATPAEFAKAEIAANDVVVFSKAYCPFCTSTKQLLDQLKIDAKVYELDQMEDGAAIQGALLDISGQRTVPNVFVKGKHLGGNDDTQAAARTGKLQELLK
ncbi:hypothetical protein THAOC_19811 [Thalassiosira oceanica]|uniref:Glutaredoxin domain-containing protein n=1 Tax=Thalassiosira oceanica TaxID=159749 RepID=K0SG28_THAOC|nr:hypothetical protein THAOC_19811 [Thalassiosira oceanica]|eukprot:EJK59906.1 hypothetical protein THAOC_19811 [Thalassiosira oceanica]